jgi:quinol monooxygenase YgiN
MHRQVARAAARPGWRQQGRRSTYVRHNRTREDRPGAGRGVDRRWAPAWALAPGQVAGYVYQTDADPGEFYLAAVFESKEAYWANASSPEQHERYLQLRALFSEDPEWHDGEIVSEI